MPDVTTQEFIVSGQVRDRFTGQHYERDTYPTGGYYTFEDAPYERWVDSDRDGWFDYGLRDEGFGHWSPWDGFGWEPDSRSPPKNDDEPRGNSVIQSDFQLAPTIISHDQALTPSPDWMF